VIIETYEYAVKNREQIVNSVDSERQGELIRAAREMWNEYKPKEIQADLVGIDSSWNVSSHHGFYVYAVDAVSVLADGSYAAVPKFVVGIDSMLVDEGREIISNPSLWLESKGMGYEYDLSVESSGKHVLIDGSVLARFYDMKARKMTTFLDYASDLMSMENISFVAKTSTGNSILHGIVGDMYYFTRATSSSGFSSPVHDRNGITVTYVRLSDHTPVLRVEVPGAANNEDIMRVMDMLSKRAYDGYPYVLRVAHERCKISNSDMEIIEGALGLSGEASSREVLGE
jgi:hypothetical protein